MMSITIPDIDDELTARLRSQAASHGQSVEDEARDILRSALERISTEPHDLAAAIRARFAPFGGFELSIPHREPMRDPPAFEP